MAPTRKRLVDNEEKLRKRGLFDEAELRLILPRRELPRVHWRRLTLTFDKNRPLFDLVREPGIRWPSGRPLRHPFLLALHRLRQPDPAGLPLRHRQALASLDQPLALARLALEESNVRAWRQLDTWPLREMVRWLAKQPFGERPAAEELRTRALTYLAACLPRDGDLAESFEAMLDLTAQDQLTATHDLVLPQLLTMALCWALDSPHRAEVRESLLAAELWLARFSLADDSASRAALPELRAEQALARGAILGLQGGYAEAEHGYRQALAALTPVADPFVRLVLLLESAAALVDGTLHDLELRSGNLADRIVDHDNPISTESADHLAALTLATLDQARPALARTAGLLREAAPLLHQHGNADQRLRYRWLRAHTRQWEDPGGSVVELIEVFEQASARGKPSWLAPIAADLIAFLPRLREVALEPRAAIMRRFHPIARLLAAIFDGMAGSPSSATVSALVAGEPS